MRGGKGREGKRSEVTFLSHIREGKGTEWNGSEGEGREAK